MTNARNWRCAALAALALVAPVLAYGQATGSPAQQEVLATDDQRTEALRQGDAAALERIYADDYTLVTPAGVIRGKKEQVDEIRTGQLHYPSIEVLERTVRDYGDVAVVLSRDKYSIMRAGQQVGGDLRFTRVYKRFGKEWRLIATHASPIGALAAGPEKPRP